MELGLFGATVEEARRRYRRFVLAGKGVDLDAAGSRRAFGPADSERRPLAEIFAAEATPIATAYRAHGYRLREIAEYLGCHYSTISRRLGDEEAGFECEL